MKCPKCGKKMKSYGIKDSGHTCWVCKPCRLCWEIMKVCSSKKWTLEDYQKESDVGR